MVPIPLVYQMIPEPLPYLMILEPLWIPYDSKTIVTMYKAIVISYDSKTIIIPYDSTIFAFPHLVVWWLASWKQWPCPSPVSDRRGKRKLRTGCSDHRESIWKKRNFSLNYQTLFQDHILALFMSFTECNIEIDLNWNNYFSDKI